MTGPVVSLADVDAWVFDLDGVLTDTARLHEKAWVEVLTGDLARLAPGDAGGAGRPFTGDDYRRLVDGELPATGVRQVLADRALALPDGSPDDAAGTTSVWGVVNAKDERYRELLGEEGPHPFEGSVDLVHRLRAMGADVAVVSASRHCADVLHAAGLDELVDVRVDGLVARAMGLPGKPDPALFLEATRRLGVDPARAVVVEDALAGVEAGRAGGFGVVVGVDRVGGEGDRHALQAHGAGIVVTDLGELEIGGTDPSAWRLVYRDPPPAQEGVVETLCTLANGYFGTRGARPWARDDGVSYPGTYVAGLYNRLDSEVEGRSIEVESFVNVPNWLPYSFRAAEGPWLGATDHAGRPGVEVVSHLVRLDLRRGTLLRRCTLVDDSGRHTALVERRLVSMSDPHLAAQEISIVPLDWSGPVELRAAIEGDVVADETQEERLLANRHLELLATGTDDCSGAWVRVRTVQSQVGVGVAVRCRLSGGAPGSGQGWDVGGHRAAGAIGLVWKGEAVAGARVTVEKAAALFTSHDRAISEPLLAAREAADAAPSFSDLAAAHATAWALLWDRATVEVSDGRSRSGTALDLHLFHLLQVASPHLVDLDTGVGARGLHGEGYLGHVFWDSLFAFPVLDHRFPGVARALLTYRIRRLPAARRAAAAAGHAGAMFPWQSGSDGRDETPTMLYNPLAGHWIPDRSRHQRHVGLAIAYCAWQHWQVTGDFEFLAGPGAELVLEVARFFASLASLASSAGDASSASPASPASPAGDGGGEHGGGERARYHIAGVMGPDEFHDGYPWSDEPGVTDNAYTNVMTAWLLRRAAEVVELLRSARRTAVLDRLALDETEIGRWNDVSSRLTVPFHDGVISQFAGYERLEPIDLDAYRSRYGNIGRMDLILDAEGDTVRRYQVGKQADVLMLFYLLSAEELRAVLGQMGYALEPELIRRTVEYYARRVTHGSTLSSIVHAWVLARADRHASWQYFEQALASDIADVQGGTTREGIHFGAMGGTADLLQRCYTGLELRGEALWLNPKLPAELQRLALTLVFREMLVGVEVDHERLVVRAAAGRAAPITVVLRGEPAVLHPGRLVEVPLQG